jgi:Mycobacteriophage tail assembly protein
MMKVTLEDLRAAADAKYGDYEIDLGEQGSVVLRNALRLPAAQRRELGALQDRLNGDGGKSTADQFGDMAETIKEVVLLLATSTPAARKLLVKVGDDLALLLELFAGYQEHTQPGEASSSAS